MKTKTSKGSQKCEHILFLVSIIFIHKNCDTLYLILLRMDIFIE